MDYEHFNRRAAFGVERCQKYEERWKAIGMVEDILVVIHTERQELTFQDQKSPA